MARKHRCKDSDHIAKIAKDKNFYYWRTVWDDDSNSGLSGRRSNPCVLFNGDDRSNGDTVEIPDIEQDTETAAIDDETVFVIPEKTELQLNLRILNPDFSPVENAEYELVIEGREEPYIGDTGNTGEIIAEELPLEAQIGRLSLRLNSEGDDAPAPGGGEDGDAEAGGEEGGNAVEGDVPVTWDLKIGALNPIMENAPNRRCLSGVQQRLNNMGFNAGPVDGVMGPNTRAAVETFQSMFRNFGLQKDGKPGQGETQPRLEDVHDKNDYVGDPQVLPAEDITPVPENRKQETTAEHIGHVAPDFKDGTFFNTLLIRPEYRISMELGDIENLFPWSIDTKAGRLARLQVLGLFYWPLNHRVAAGGKSVTAPGLTAKPINPARLADNRAAYNFIWAYFKEKFCGGGADDTVAEEELKRRLREWVVQKFDDAGHGAGGELPAPTAVTEQGDPSESASLANGNYAKIRFPGGWCFLMTDAALFDHNRDPSINGIGMYDRKYDFETACYNQNPILGKIPLVAKVEMYMALRDEWVPARDRSVYFQLLRPYDLPDFINDVNRLNSQPNHPAPREGAYSVTHPNPPTRPNTDGTSLPLTERRAGPGYFTHVWDNYAFDAADPQGNNCHNDCGGKRGNPVGGRDVHNHVFMLGEVPGFSKVHDDPPANPVIDWEGRPARVLDPEPSLNRVHNVADANHPHAVRTQTNDDGEAGVIFMASRCGGDTYRIRAYVGPDTLENDGKDMNSVRVDTGTFVVWRNIRISRFVRQPLTEAGLNTVMINQHLDSLDPTVNRADNAPIGPNDRKSWMSEFLAATLASWKGLPAHDMNTVSDGNVGSSFDGFRPALARAFCEFEEDPGFAAADITRPEWDAAVLCGLEDTKQVGLVAGPLGYDAVTRAGLGAPTNRIDNLFFREAGNMDGITVSNGFCIPALTSIAFDARTGTNLFNTGGDAAVWRAEVGSIVQNFMLTGFMRHVAQNGYLPGMTFIQAVHLTNLAQEAGFNSGYSGIATHYHGAFIHYGQDAYPANIGDSASLNYGFTANSTHEMGHVLFSVHAPGNNDHNSCAGGVRTVPGNDCTQWHDCHGLLVDNANAPTNANFPGGHDNAGEPRGNPSYGTCLMSYRDCEGQFCSRCLFQLRGWDSRSARMRAGDAALPPYLDPVNAQWVEEGAELPPVDLTARDMQGRALTFSAVGLPDGADLTDNLDGTARFTWTPDAGTAGVHTVVIQVTEAGVVAPPQPARNDTCALHITVLRPG